jgi:peptide chain release factor 2
MNDLIKRLENLLGQLTELQPHLNLPQKDQKILELESQMQMPDFWTDNETAQKVSQEYNQLKQFHDFWQNLQKNTKELLDMVKQNTDESMETLAYLEQQTAALENEYNKNRFVLLLSKKYDDHNAIFSIHAGAGGVDAQDWAEILLRQYLRYCERKGFKSEVVELNKGQDAGIKSATVEVHGPYAYGLLKSEAGVHRLVRLSPFNPAHTRETSFALLELLPLLEEQEQVKLDPKDLDIEANTASGHGGQSVNTTYSAIRITHKPTGLKVSIQNERSQHQNKELALKILAAKVQTLEDEKLAKEKKEMRGEFKSAEWGNQIRSYVIHPYKLVKDHRTNYEESEPDKVFDGEIDEFVEKYLEAQVS